jgi:hypothetical protein
MKLFFGITLIFTGSWLLQRHYKNLYIKINDDKELIFFVLLKDFFWGSSIIYYLMMFFGLLLCIYHDR